MRVAVVMMLTGGLFSPCDEPDSQRIQGTWETVSVVMDGEPRPKMVHGRTLKVEGDAFTMMSHGKVRRTGTFTLDPTKTPKRIDISAADTFATPGLYELEG